MENITSEQKQFHDLLLPFVSAVSHPSDCPICNSEPSKEIAAVTDEIQAQIDEAVANATASVKAELEAANAELAKIQSDSQVSELTAKVDELQAGLDQKIAELSAANEKLDSTIAYLSEVHADEVKAAEAAEKRDERVKAIEDLNLFTGDEAAHIEASADRWADMSDEAWDSQFTEYKAIAARLVSSDPVTQRTDPAPTKITASADTSVMNSAYEDARAVVNPTNRQIVSNL